MIGRLHRDERGAQYVEYLAGLLLVAVAGLGGWRAFGDELGSTTGEGEQAVRTMAGRSPGAVGRDALPVEAAPSPRRRFVPPPEWAVPYEEPFLGVDWDYFWSESWRRTKNLVAGDFNGDQDGSDITAQVFLGLTPAGVVADVRDIGANAYGVWQGRDGAWIGLGAASVGLIPGLGDGLKPLIKGGRELVSEGVEATVDAARLGGREVAEDTVDDLVESGAGGAPRHPADPIPQGSHIRREARVPAGARQVSDLYLHSHRIPEGTRIPDGFADGGPASRIGPDGRVSGTNQEVIVIDRARDSRLRQLIEQARDLRRLPPRERAERLAEIVDRRLTRFSPAGEIDPSRKIARQYAGEELLIGDYIDTLGVCRHRALLYKVLADEAGLDVALVRGTIPKLDGQGGRILDAAGNPTFGGHAWNEVVLPDGSRLLVDPYGRGFGYGFRPPEQLRNYYLGWNMQPIYGAPVRP